MLYCANIWRFLRSKLRKLFEVSFNESSDFLLVQWLTPSWFSSFNCYFRIFYFVLLWRLNLRLIWLTWYLCVCLGSTLIDISAIHIRKDILGRGILLGRLVIITLTIISLVWKIRWVAIRPLVILGIGHSTITIVLLRYWLLLLFKLFKCIHFKYLSDD